MIRQFNNHASFSNSGEDKNIRQNNKRPLSPSRRLRYDAAEASPTTGGDAISASKDADMDVTGAGSVGGAGAVRPVHLARTTGVDSAPATGVQVPQDEVLISDAARSLSGMQLDPQIRAARLAEIKTAIEAGTYDTPQRLEAAIEKMISTWGRGA